jgi:hypothetical protein
VHVVWFNPPLMPKVNCCSCDLQYQFVREQETGGYTAANRLVSTVAKISRLATTRALLASTVLRFVINISHEVLRQPRCATAKARANCEESTLDRRS